MATPGGDRKGTLTLKICLAGEAGVGKSSLVHRFVLNTFDDRYISTLGAKVSSKRYSVEDPGQPGRVREVTASVWDIMGHPGFREVFQAAYFDNAQAVLLVCDASRPETLHTLPAWSSAVRAVVGVIPTILLVNKMDLSSEAKISTKEVEALCAEKGWRWMTTSAKTGENVEEAFQLVAQLHLERLKRSPAKVAIQ